MLASDRKRSSPGHTSSQPLSSLLVCHIEPNHSCCPRSAQISDLGSATSVSSWQVYCCLLRREIVFLSVALCIMLTCGQDIKHDVYEVFMKVIH